MNEKGQLMGVPIKLVIALVIGVMSMGIMTQFVNTADRTMLRDMEVKFETTKNQLKVRTFDAQSHKPLTGVTIVVNYSGNKLAHTLDADSNSYTFSIPKEDEVVIASVRVTRNGYIPWKGEAALKT